MLPRDPPAGEWKWHIRSGGEGAGRRSLTSLLLLYHRHQTRLSLLDKSDHLLGICSWKGHQTHVEKPIK